METKNAQRDAISNRSNYQHKEYKIRIYVTRINAENVSIVSDLLADLC